MDWEIGCIGFLASFNGRGFDGGYAKPSHRDYYQESKRNLEKQSQNPLFQDCMFGVLDYKNIIVDKLQERFVVYCDPPYFNTKGYKNSDGFNHEYFWNWCRNLSKFHIVVVSEESAPEDFKCVWKQDITRCINAVNKTVSTEKLFVRFPSDML